MTIQRGDNPKGDNPKGTHINQSKGSTCVPLSAPSPYPRPYPRRRASPYPRLSAPTCVPLSAPLRQFALHLLKSDDRLFGFARRPAEVVERLGVAENSNV